MSNALVFDKVVVFQSQEEEYGIPIQYVVSIEKLQPLTAVPNMPHYMNGVTTIRGEVTPILDSNKILYKKETEITEKTRMIIVQTEALSFGLIVDDAKEIIDIPGESIQKLNLVTYQVNSYIVGVAKLTERLLTLLDPTKLLETLEEMEIVKEQLV